MISDKTKELSELREQMFKVQRLKAGPGLSSMVPDRQRRTTAMACLREFKAGRDRHRKRLMAPEGIVLK